MMSALHAAPAGEILTAMPIDDAVAALRHIDSDRSAALLDRIPSQRAAELRRLLALPPETAGGLMTTEVLTAREDEPLDAIRAQVAAEPPLLEGLATVFLHDEAGRYVSALTPSALLTGAPPKPLPALAVDTPLDEVIGIFALEDVLALPVLDAQGRIAGAVAIDDVLEELLVERLPHHRRRYRHLRLRDRVQA
jgi:Mg/Co/Ni transporter MgtE